MTYDEYLKLSKELQDLSKRIPLKWGKVQNNATDDKIDMFSCSSVSSLESEISDLEVDDRNYFRRRWFLWKCAQVDEYLFYRNENVKKNPDHKDQSWDIIFNDSLCFDVKGTIVPRSLRSSFKLNEQSEKEMIDFYYREQSQGVRYNVQNRLFIVHHSFRKDVRSIYLRCHWELKKLAYKEFNHRITASGIKLIEHGSVLAKCIFILESKDNRFYHKII